MVVIKMSSWLTAMELVYGAREADRDDSALGTGPASPFRWSWFTASNACYDKAMYPVARTLRRAGALENRDHRGGSTQDLL